MRNNEKGFSLIELMIVVAIIGILAAIAIPNFQQYQAKSRQGEAKSLLTGIFTSQKAFHAENLTFNGDFGRIGFDPNGNLRYDAGFAADCGAANINAAVYTGVAPSGFTTVGAHCGGGGDCQAVWAAAPTAPTGVCTGTTFTADAIGDIDGDPAEDRWTIDQAKNLTVLPAENDLNN